ncbi:protein SRC2 homolog isoform X2 [Cucumis sativus]|uniref:protein SRC2 homolog isoform X2 n=1 Tax=Cucumis sativus TaxID=3659 RepID=UPI0012F4D03F|nr:protein SRC2 homolog isoform X2 [Cucumis sativus]
MEVRPLEIRIIKAHDLKDVNLITKMDVYAVVSISGDHLNNQKQKTTVDKDAGPNPSWDFPMTFTVDDAGNEVKFGSFSVRLSNGKAKGTLDLAYKFGEKHNIESLPPLPPHTTEQYAQKEMEPPPVMAYPSTFPTSSSSYPPPADAYPPPPSGYPNAPPPGAYPQSHSGGYPPPPGYGYPPAGYGYGGGYQQPPPGYGYQPMKPPKKNGGGGGMGVGIGIGAGLVGGLLIGDMMSDF